MAPEAGLAGEVPASPWAAGWRGRAVSVAYRTAGALLARVPDTLSVPVAVAVSRGLLAARGEERAMYTRHLGRVLGRPVGEAEAALAMRRVAASYARYWVEMFRLPAVPGEAVDARMHLETGWPELQAALDSDRGVIIALPHLGSWEWGGAWLARRGHPMTAVAEVLQPPELFEWFVRQRRAMGITVVPLTTAAGPVLARTLRAGGLVGLVADRDLLGTGVPVSFFGEKTTLPAGPATLALRTGAALFPVAVYQGPGSGHTGVVLPALDTARSDDLRSDVQRVTQDLADGFEVLIRRAPEQWFCFQPNWPGDRDVSSNGAGGERQARQRVR